MSKVVELHAHTHFSPLDGLNTPEEYMARAKELGMSHMAITDHGTLAGHRDFVKAGDRSADYPGTDFQHRLRRQSTFNSHRNRQLPYLRRAAHVHGRHFGV